MAAQFSSLITVAVAVLVIALISILKRIYDFVQLIRTHSQAVEGIKTIPSHWFYGHVKGLNKFDKSFLNRIVDSIHDCPKVTYRWIGFFRCSLLLHFPSVVKEVLSTAEPKDNFTYRILAQWIGDGLLVSNGAKWKRNRRLLTPAFHFDMLKKYLRVFNATTHTLCDKWSNQTTVKAFHNVSLMTLDSILQCAMSSKTDCQNVGSSHPYISAVYEMSEIAMKRILNVFYAISFIFNISSLGRRNAKLCKVAHEFSQREIDKRKKLYLTDPGRKQKGGDFLDILLLAKDENGKGLTDIEIRNEVDTFLFEGHDTTASGISWALYNLAIHPKYQEKCREEVNAILGERETVENADLSQMNYLTMCIKESLRLYSPVSLVNRRLTKPIHFPRGFGSDQTKVDESAPAPPDANKTFPVGMPIAVRIIGLHRNKYVWDDPEVFDPDRFLPENVAKRSPFAFVPFSAGPRNCIGQNFAMMEMKVALALCLKKFRFSLDENFPKPEIYMTLITKAKDDIHLKIENL